LHDIGKLEIAGAVLNKPGALDADEWDLIRAHPLDGARIAAPLMAWLGEWSGGIPEHHERYDGTGYPLGLAGTGISRAGRMVAVIDAFETMTASRSYKQPMNTRAARAELARCAGTHFDPLAVRAFLNISLPRLLWAMGPLALLVHLPFLRSLETAGSQVGSAVATGAGATVLAVGVTVAPAPQPAPHPAQQPRIAAEREAGSPGRPPAARPTVQPGPAAVPPVAAGPSPRPRTRAVHRVPALRDSGDVPERRARRSTPTSAPRPPAPSPWRTAQGGGDDHRRGDDVKQETEKKKQKDRKSEKDDD
jgi:hypothetical protein